MKSKTLTSALRALSLLLLVSATCALAQDRKPVHFSGLINDYSPLNSTVKDSPYEMHGQWSMDLRPEWGTADFAADMTMSGYRENRGRRRRSDTAPREPSHAPHQADQRQDHLGHDRLPRIPASRHHNGLSVERHGQPDDGEWKHCPLRDGSAFIDAAGLRHRRERGPVLDREFEHYAGVRGTCDNTFRAAGHPWRRA